MNNESFEVFCNELLDAGLDTLDLSLGIVSKIVGTSYFLLAVRSDSGVFKPGETYELKDTYCREVYEQKQTVALTYFDNTPGLCKHPLYSGLPLESYISTPIIVACEVIGTLNFSSLILREDEFTNEEIEYVESKAKAIADRMIEAI